MSRVICTAICLCLLVCSAADLVPRASAASALTASESCIDFIKKAEGFSAKPYYDYSQHTVGYGTRCPTDKYFDYMVNGITKEEAEVLLRETVADIAAKINQQLADKYNLTFTQHQFDALVSFSFNIGTSWMTYDSTLRNALLRNADINELVYAFSLYSTAGGQYLSSLISRRLCEANIYLNGVYSQNVSNSYGYVFFEPNGGSLTYRVQGFLCENNAAPVADAVRNGDVFVGWYTDLSGGTKVAVLNRELSGKTLFARWQSSENEESENAVSTVITVTGDVVNIRKGPGTNYGIAKQVRQNDILVVSHVTQLTNMTWGKVQDGWICLDYTNYNQVVGGTVQPEEDSNGTSSDVTAPENDSETTAPAPDAIAGTVRVNDLLRIRSGPGTTYATVGYLTNGTAVEILQQQTNGSMNWGRTTRGWVSMDYIITQPSGDDETPEPGADHIQETEPERTPETEPAPAPETEPSQEPEAENPVQSPETEQEENMTGSAGTAESVGIKGKITADLLRIRSAAGTDNRIVGFYYQDQTVTVIERMLISDDYWGKTDKGWINLDYFMEDSSAPSEEAVPPATTGNMTVVADCLRVRKGTGTEYRIAELLYFGDTVHVFETTTVDGTVWGRVENGWICMDYVK